jgi:acetoacetyl-CoA synthetase
MSTILWTPSAEFAESTNLARFQRFARDEFGGPADDSYESLHRWSLDRRGAFWSAVWRFAGVIGDVGAAAADPGAAYVPGPHLTEAKWFPGAALNFAENLLRPGELNDETFGEETALYFRSETGGERGMSRRELYGRATAFAAFLRSRGVRAGDRVAALVPNIPEAVAAMLGTAAIGAVWSSCSPDFGEDAICDRFGQIEPAVLVTATEAHYNGKRTDVLAKVGAVLPRLPTVRACVVAENGIGWPTAPPGVSVHSFHEASSGPTGRFRFERFPFDHPVYILYSSGTTGAPKCIVHGAGGTLLQHLKEHQLHTDIRSGDRLFYFTTTGWMMWNWLVSALASRATVVLYDGSPFHPTGEVLWDLADRARLTHFGASAKYFAHLEKLGVKPKEKHDLAALRVVLSTGSPLSPESFDYVYRDVKPDVCLSSISGGTDIISCFALGCPTEPVRRGELQVKGLGMDVHVFDEDGKPVVGEPGELVCTSPFPSMPVYFWNDPDKKKYLGSYFGVFDNVWCHGDWAEETPTGGLVIYGRSDTTLNPGGVRIGTAEIYQQVETFPEIAESLATALRRGGDEQVVLFVRMQPGKTLTPVLVDALKQRLKTRCSPRHVPAFVVEAPDLPRTVSGKLSEVAVRNAINGLPIKNTGALANPDALEFFRALRVG